MARAGNGLRRIIAAQIASRRICLPHSACPKCRPRQVELSSTSNCLLERSLQQQQGSPHRSTTFPRSTRHPQSAQRISITGQSYRPSRRHSEVVGSCAVDRTMDELADQVRSALVAEDVSAFAGILDPDVTWGAPGARNPTCKNRNQVLSWYQQAREGGVRGSVFDVDVFADRLVVSLSVQGTEGARERGGTSLRFQVLTVRDGRIVEIVGFDEKTEALSYAQ